METMLEPGPKPFYGLGVYLYADGVGHDGSVAGYHSQLRHDPDEDLAVVALSNESLDPAGSGVADPIAREVHDIASEAVRAD